MPHKRKGRPVHRAPAPDKAIRVIACLNTAVLALGEACTAATSAADMPLAGALATVFNRTKAIREKCQQDLDKRNPPGAAS